MASTVETDRLSIRPRAEGTLVDLVPLEPVGAGPFATVRVAKEEILLDALRVRAGDGASVVYTSAFSPIAQLARISRWTLRLRGEALCEDIHFGVPGEVLWWLQVRDGALSVRDVSRGRTVPLGTLRPSAAASRRASETEPLHLAAASDGSGR